MPYMEASTELLINASLAFLIIAIGVAFFWSGLTGAGKTAATCSTETDATAATERLASTVELAGEASPTRSAGAAAAASAGIAAATENAKVSAKSAQIYYGEVKRFSDRNGMGFISCARLRAKHGVDVRIYRDEYEAAHLRVGDSVAFHTVFGGRLNCPKNHPWATDVRKSDIPEEDAALDEEEEAEPLTAKPAPKSERRELRADPPSAPPGGGDRSLPASTKKPMATLETLKSLKGDAPKAAALPGRRLIPPGTPLDAKAPEFKPRASLGSPTGSTPLKSNAPEFVPAAPARAFTSLRAGAPAFVPAAGGCMPTAAGRASFVAANG